MSKLPQLRMVHRLDQLPPELPVPKGYRLRLAVQDDSAALDALLSAAFGEGWPPGSVGEILLDHPEVPQTFVVEHGRHLVATASYQLKPAEFPGSGWVHYVAADQAHSGRGLGRLVTGSVLDLIANNGHERAFLTTDDWRLPAISTYLNLGFGPDNCDPSHDERWRKVFEALRRP